MKLLHFDFVLVQCRWRRETLPRRVRRFRCIVASFRLVHLGRLLFVERNPPAGQCLLFCRHVAHFFQDH